MNREIRNIAQHNSFNLAQDILKDPSVNINSREFLLAQYVVTLVLNTPTDNSCYYPGKYDEDDYEDDCEDDCEEDEEFCTDIDSRTE